MTVVGDGTQKRDFTNIKDVVDANIKASLIEDKKAYGEIFNIGTGKNYSMHELVALLGGEVEYIPPRKGEVKETLANIEKAKNILNWEPTISLEDWVDKSP